MVQAGNTNSGIGRRDSDRFSMTTSVESSPFLLASHEVVEAAARSVCEDLLDDAILSVTFEVHRSMKRGLLSLEAGIPEDESRFYQVHADGLDVFGQPPIKKQHECICPNCSRNLAASRFAPHLEKCMGMGRNSSRIASRRIQSVTRDNNSHLLGQGSDDDDDEDWYLDRKRRKRDKNSPRRSRSLKICGMVSEQTGKICTRSMRCAQHHLEQRRVAREQMTSVMADSEVSASCAASLNSKYLLLDGDEVQVDNDSIESEGCHFSSSWDHDLSNTTSPADSTSTNHSSSTASSTSSSYKKSSSKSKKKSSKHSKKDNSHSNMSID